MLERQGSGTVGIRGSTGHKTEQKSGEGGFPQGHLKHRPLEGARGTRTPSERDGGYNEGTGVWEEVKEATN